MGYIGLPTASTLATHGMSVLGVDVDERVLDVLQNGEVHIQEPGLSTLVRAAFHSGNLRVGKAPEAADAFIIAVPTPVLKDKRADMHYVTSAAESIVPHLRRRNLVVLESTSPPRTTLELVAPILEKSGLQAGEDFYLAYSPERVLPGHILRELIENARVVGGIDRASAEAGRDLYRTFVRGEIVLADATTAEMVKLMENTYRDVNIAAANEFARLAERFGVDVWQAVQLANRHPRVDILKPGPGVGGHCISIDPWFLVEGWPEENSVIHRARQVNDAQPGYVLEALQDMPGGLPGQQVAALGLTYKADVDDLRESPAIEVVSLMVASGANVRTYEPYLPETVVPGTQSVATVEEALRGADLVVLLVDHESLRRLDPGFAAQLMRTRLAFDARGSWDRSAWEDAGFELHVLGVGEMHG
jgi:UDP-N-acetyl-D-mannosaminuronic acid dehydrogenase